MVLAIGSTHSGVYRSAGQHVTMRARKSPRSWQKECIWRVIALFGVEGSGCDPFKLSFLEPAETRGYTGVKLA